MERREPDFEDERIRTWRARPEDDPVDREDPTMLGVGENEEIYESRVYQVRPAFYQRLVVEQAEDDPDLAIAALLALSNPEESTFRVMAKRNKKDGTLTFILVGSLGGNRALLDREDAVDEERFRTFIQEFEEGVFSRGLASEPAVVTAEQWRAYDPRQSTPPGTP